ncbi:MAG: hypothetical protein ACFE9Z_02210 [Promethearchaeota archaeon]
MNQNNIKTFNCDLNDTNLFSCILEELGEENVVNLSEPPQIVQDKTFINCLNASLVNCLRINREELDFPKVQLELSLTKDENWLIKQVNIVVDKQFDDNLIYDRINQCLKFVKKACNTDEKIKFSIIKSEIKEDLKNYQVQLSELNQLIRQVRKDESIKEKLFSLFRDISSTK